MNTKSYYVVTKKATGCIDVNGNRITKTPPIWSGWIGRAWSSFKTYYKPTKVLELAQPSEIRGLWKKEKEE